MWWKLVGVALCTALLVFAVIPIRTRAVVFDPANPPPPPPLFAPISSMYLTPFTVVQIGIILVVAAIIAVRIVRG